MAPRDDVRDVAPTTEWLAVGRNRNERRRLPLAGVSISPPARLHAAASSSAVDPQQIAAVEGTVASLTIEGSAARGG
jgi:hypothetical protein